MEGILHLLCADNVCYIGVENVGCRCCIRIVVHTTERMELSLFSAKFSVKVLHDKCDSVGSGKREII